MTPSLRHPAVAALALLGLLVVLSLAMDPGGFLGSDTGAKVATLEVMDQRSTADPDVGYWAERRDPDGDLHPLYQTRRTEEGAWVAVTTLPMLEAARPLYGLGGYRATLALPMLGSLGCAFGARAIARRTGGGDGWLSFWVVGVASPILIYGLDLWEHSVGVAAIVGAVVLLLDAVGRPGWWRPLAAGALLGLAATMRTEAVIYALVATGVTCLAVARQERRLPRAAAVGALTVVGFAVPWLLNRWLELSVGGLSRSTRASGAASSVGSELGPRIRESLVTLTGLKGDGYDSVFLGLGVLLAVLVAARAERRGDRPFAVIALVGAALPYVVAMAAGLSFIPGMLVTFPLAVGALVAPRSGPRGLVVTMALAALPLVWAFQYVGGAGPQWGGRYTLASAVLLTAVGAPRLVEHFRLVGRGVLALSVGVSVLSVVWLGVRSRSVDAFFERLRTQDAEVVVARNGFLLREGGAATVGRHWLSATSDEAVDDAVEVARRSGAQTVAIVYDGPEPEVSDGPPGWSEIERWDTDLAGTSITVVTYETHRTNMRSSASEAG